LIDWLLVLPEELTVEFRRELRNLKWKKRMPYITNIEFLGRQEGRVQTLREDILDILEARFGEVSYALREQITVLSDESELKRLHRQAALTTDLLAFTHGSVAFESA